MGIDPVSLATIGKVVSTVSAGVGALSQMQAASYQQAVAENNARIAEENARRAVEDSQRETVDFGEEARQEIGALVAAQSASGLSLDVGSSLLRRRAGERLAKRDSDRLREAGNLRAQGFNQQAADAKAEAKLASKRRGFALLGGGLSVADSFIGGSQSVNKARSLVS